MLLDAAAWRAEEYLRGVGGAEHSAHAEYAAGFSSADRSEADPGRSDEQRAGSATTCGWCPICAVAGLLRGERPELTSRLTEQLAGLIDLLRESLAEHRGPNPGSAAPPTAEPGEPGGAEPASPKVQRIDVRRVRGRAAAHVPDAGHATATGEFEC